jgi:hypothetical protein
MATRPFDQPLREAGSRACPIYATSVLNGTDNYRLRCYLWLEKNCALWNVMIARRRPHAALMKMIRDQTTPRKRPSRWVE